MTTHVPVHTCSSLGRIKSTEEYAKDRELILDSLLHYIYITIYTTKIELASLTLSLYVCEGVCGVVSDDIMKLSLTLC